MRENRNWKPIFWLFCCATIIVIGIFQPWGKTGQWLFVLLSIAAVTISYFFLRRSIQSEEQRRQALLIGELAAMKRHDLLNHVQLLMSYVSMNRPEKVKEYLQRMTEQANQERKLTEFTLPDLVSYLMLLPYTYKRWKWSLDVTGEIKKICLSQQKQLLSILPIFIKKLNQMGANQTRWETIKLRITGEEDKLIVLLEVLDSEGGWIPLFPTEQKWREFSTLFHRTDFQVETVENPFGVQLEWKASKDKRG